MAREHAGHAWVDRDGTSRRYGFLVRIIAPSCVVVRLEDYELKQLWHLRLTKPEVAVGPNRYPGHDITRAAQHLAKCLSRGTTVCPLLLRATRDGKFAKLHLPYSLDLGGTRAIANYELVLRQRVLGRVDLLDARVRDLEAASALCPAHERPMSATRSVSSGTRFVAWLTYGYVTQTVHQIPWRNACQAVVGRLQVFASAAMEVNLILVGLVLVLVAYIVVTSLPDDLDPPLFSGELRLTSHKEVLRLKALRFGSCYTFWSRFPWGVSSVAWRNVEVGRSTEIIFYEGSRCHGKQVCLVVGSTGNCAGDGLQLSGSFAVSDLEFSSSWFTTYRHRWL